MKLALLSFTFVSRLALYLPAVSAEFKSGSLPLLTGNGIRLARLCGFAEIYVPENDLFNKFKTERHIGRLKSISLLDAPGLKISQHLTHVKLWLSVLGTVVDADFRIITIGNRLFES